MTQISNTETIATTLKFPAAWQGACWKMISCAAFAGINGIVRYLSHGGDLGPDNVLSTNVMMFFQNLFGTMLILPFFWRSGLKLSSTQHGVLHLIRVATAVLGISLWYLTLKYMPIAEGVALTFTGPVFTVIGAALLLGEKIGPKRIAAICLSLIGAFIISRPDKALLSQDAGFGWVVLLPLTSAISIAWNKILTRKLAKLGESPESLATYLLLLMIPVSLIPALFDWTWPHATHWPWLFLLGLFATIAHLSFGKAYKLSEVTFLTPFGFSKFLFSTLIGFYFFSEIPSNALWIGIAVIGGSIFLLTYKIPLYSIARRFRSS